MKPLPLVLCTLLWVGCTPKAPVPRPQPTPAARPAVSVAPIPAAPGPTPAPGAKTVTPVPLPTPPPRPFDESILRGREFLLEPSKVSPPVVRDRALGALGTRSDLTAAVTAFFAGVAQGSVDETTLVPRWKDYLLGWARRVKAEGWTAGTVRVGVEVADQTGGWMVPVRVVTPAKQWSGWVALVPDGTKVLVSDVQVEGSAPEDAPFDPESQGQEISSPSRR